MEKSLRSCENLPKNVKRDMGDEMRGSGYSKVTSKIMVKREEFKEGESERKVVQFKRVLSKNF